MEFTRDKLKALLIKFKKLPKETEWLEFKKAEHSFSFEELGKYFSALSNEARLQGKDAGWLILGVEDQTRGICGTSFKETGGLDKIKFIKFLEENIKDKYKNHLITLDNARFHRSKEVKEYIEHIGNKYLYCVRYRPKTNAIENFFSQLKHYIKLTSPQTYEEIVITIRKILQSNIKIGVINIPQVIALIVLEQLVIISSFTFMAQ